MRLLCRKNGEKKGQRSYKVISVTTDMIFRACLFSLLLGLIYGIVSVLFFRLLHLIEVLIFRLLKKDATPFLISDTARHVFSFLFTFCVGLSYILIIYAFTDGVFYFCTLLALLFGFLISKGFFGLILRKKTNT